MKSRSYKRQFPYKETRAIASLAERVGENQRDRKGEDGMGM